MKLYNGSPLLMLFTIFTALDMVKNQSTKVHSPLYGPDMTVHYLQGLGKYLPFGPGQ